ncbi:Anti-sigma regulatory factor (Ser/Thr protein kinase) [Fodinibius salinus]|uniref:Anti-sigma regulatory factor (Ser/Thr protein kinase) n=1 Tax=Fodinibius salinus TaxID=860790 RepID=A0A5D3YKB6_9BACT|nr:GNAT family N-acetyltransferase [Fodinibius salinus]TYP93992.1 Anti-sigma regulatory factor (Ser/Thr protein kinase) [Fodinibius salinus]
MDAKFEISTDEQIINPVCDFTYSWGVNCGLSKGEALRFSVAVSELITDVILFAFPGDSKENFEIEFSHTFSNVEIVVSEMGEPFDPDRHTYDVQKVRDEDDFDGAGFLLMKSFSDEFSFINKGKEGKEFRIAKNIQIHDIDELLLQSAEEREAEIRDEEDQDPHIKIENFTVDRIKHTDAEDISKLFYRTYGYTYNKEDLYLPKKVEESVLAKDKLGVIARKQDNEAIGYFGVNPKDNSDIAEVAEAVVSPKYRRNGVMSSMMDRLIEIAKSKQLTMLLGEAVTIHPVSQKVNNKFGYKTTAIELASSINVKYKGFDEDYPQPVSIALDFLPLIQPSKKAVYLPEKYNEIILDTYDELGMDVDPKETESYQLADKSDIDLEIDYSSSSSLIIVKKYGNDFLTVLSDMVDSLEEKSPKTILLDLPLENRATPQQFLDITSLNFIYSGLLPQYHFNTDYLRLQKVYAGIDFNIIDIYSDFGKKIKSLIADEYHSNSKER